MFSFPLPTLLSFFLFSSGTVSVFMHLLSHGFRLRTYFVTWDGRMMCNVRKWNSKGYNSVESGTKILMFLQAFRDI